MLVFIKTEISPDLVVASAALLETSQQQEHVSFASLERRGSISSSPNTRP
jgi:hypothetical protein